jgi:hypothetical protein
MGTHDSGEVPAYLLAAFAEYISGDGALPEIRDEGGEPITERALLNAVTRSRAVMPPALCAALWVPAGTTYAEGVASWLEN